MDAFLPSPSQTPEVGSYVVVNAARGRYFGKVTAIKVDKLTRQRHYTIDIMRIISGVVSTQQPYYNVQPAQGWIVPTRKDLRQEADDAQT